MTWDTVWRLLVALLLVVAVAGLPVGAVVYLGLAVVGVVR